MFFRACSAKLYLLHYRNNQICRAILDADLHGAILLGNYSILHYLHVEGEAYIRKFFLLCIAVARIN